MQTSLNNDLNNSLSTSPIRAHINQATFDILKSELQMTKTQLNDARTTHTFLKREKQKAEHERDLALQQIDHLNELLKEREQTMDDDQAKIAQLAERYNKQRDLGEILSRRQQESEDNFKEKINAFN